MSLTVYTDTNTLFTSFLQEVQYWYTVYIDLQYFYAEFLFNSLSSYILNSWDVMQNKFNTEDLNL